MDEIRRTAWYSKYAESSFIIKNTSLIIRTENGTGTHSIFAEYEDSEIMFHVSTLLPSASNDTEKVI